MDLDKDEPQIFEVSVEYLVRVDDPDLVIRNALDSAKRIFTGEDLEERLEELSGDVLAALVSVLQPDELADVPGTTAGTVTLFAEPLTDERRNQWDFKYDKPK